MILYIVRHGDADTPAASDDERELSKKGRKVTAAMGELLKDAEFEVPELILASPLPRAQQTATILREKFAPNAVLETSEVLQPSSSLDAAMSVLASKHGAHDAMMIVGHDPLFSRLASAIITGSSDVVIEMKKSSVVVVELYRFDVPRLRGALRAYLPPQIVF